MSRTHIHLLVLICSGLVLCPPGRAATPQEEAFLKVWGAHQRAPHDHRMVINTCQSVMDRSATLGEYLPTVKTLAAWHLLASGKSNDARRIFESALSADKGAAPLTRYADTMARRWLSRMDRQLVERALQKYYAEHVAFPASLAALRSLTALTPPPEKDRFGDPWSYELGTFSKLAQLKQQRYRLYSKNMGNRLSGFKALPLESYGALPEVFIVGRKTATPISIEFEIRTSGGSQRGVATESGLIGGNLRFIKISSDLRFAILIDSEADYWGVAGAQGGR